MTQRPRAGLSIPHWWPPSLAGVFLIALAVRLLTLYEISASPVWGVLFIDSAQYDAWARQIAGGDWLGEGVFFMAPLYPYFLGALYTFFGTKIASVLIVQAVFGSASCVLLAIAGNLFFSARAGLVAGFLLAIYPAAIFADTQIQKSVLDIFLITLLLVVLGLALRHPSPRYWLLTGAVLGGLLLTRENSVVFLPVLLLYILIVGKALPRRTVFIQLTSLLLGLAMLLAPVALRNLIRGGELFFTSAQFGYNLYIGNNPRSEGGYTPLIPGREGKEQQDARELAETTLRRPLSYREVSHYWRNKAFDFIQTHPGAWLGLMMKKCFLLLNALELPDSYDQYTYGDWSIILRILTSVFHFGVLLPLAVGGVIVTWHRRTVLWPLYSLSIAYAASVVVFFVMSRYRLPLVPMLIPFAAVFISDIVLQPAHWRMLRPRMIPALLAAALIANWPSHHAAEKPHYKATLLNNIAATIAYQPGRSEEVIRLINESLKIDPHFGPAYYFLGLAYKDQGRFVESLSALLKSSSMLPDIPEPYHLVGQVYFELNQPVEAINWYRKALSIDPEEPMWLIDLAKALRALGDFTGERSALEQALAIGGKDLNVRAAVMRAGVLYRSVR